MMHVTFKTYDFPIGTVTITADEKVLHGVYFGKVIQKDYEPGENEIICKTASQLREYFEKNRRNFSIPIEFQGTLFETKVWNELIKIPYGETRSYEDIAKIIGNSKACRAVGAAVHKNPIPIIVPCHRVIGKNQKLVGYAGGLETKKYLLDLEKF